MRIGVLRETKDGERRVALLPAEVAALVAEGHEVLVESGAGVLAGAGDEAFVAAGAQVVTRDEVWGCTLVVKVKEPQPEEFRFFRPGLRLFCFLHLAAEPVLAAALTEARVEAYAFEDVRVGGRLVLLEPMSQVAGRAAAVVAPYLLSTASGGSGVLPGGVDRVRPGKAVVVGVGVAGEAAARGLAGAGMRVWGADVDVARMSRLVSEGVLECALDASSPALRTFVADADVVVGAALVPGRRAPVVVSEGMVASMRPGSVVVDIAVDQGGCVETCRPTSLSDPVFVAHGVLHYCVPNMPGQFPVSSSAALSSVLRPLVAELAASGEGFPLHGGLAVSGGRVLR